jgi:asparagine synthase (glutamine-hydrolysing)
MCGIAGIVDSGIESRAAYGAMSSMLETIRQRGPDDWGMAFMGFGTQAVGQNESRIQWLNIPGPRMVLGHRRLSILDLSTAGRQPMWSHDGRYCISYNGEIYNYLELRKELGSQRTFSTGTDTEVLLEAYRQWGLDMLQMLDGMFAFALLDTKTGQLTCARDPIGIKPFYFSAQNGRFVFASEPKAVLTGLGTGGHIDAVRVAEFLTLGVSDHDDGTSYQEVRQLRPGHWMTLNSRGIASEPTRYWNHPDALLEEDTDVPRVVREQIQLSIHRQLRSDVPVGSCLSGGLDSGAVIATVGRTLQQKAAVFKALTLVNKDFVGDESALASATASRAGVDWTPVEPRTNAVAVELEEMARAMDEPFPSLSMFAQRKIMQRAAELGLKVMLDGQGGDEVFLGYPRVAQRVASEHFRRGSLLVALREWNAFARNGSQSRLRMAAGTAFFSSPRVVQWRNSRQVSSTVQADMLQQVRPETTCQMYEGGQSVFRVQLGELMRFCLPQLLRFEDRNSMAYGIEARVPLLGIGVVELGLRLPLQWKVRDGWTKYALRVAMEDSLPKEIVWCKRKRGFEVPQKRWVEAARPAIAKWLSDLPNDSPIKVEHILTAIDQGKGGEPWLWRCLSVAMWMQFSGVRV